MPDTPIRTIEQRRYQRIAVPQGVGIRVSGREGGKVVEGLATVIGPGGMFCRTKDILPPGTVIKLRLTCAAASFEVECSVRHANEHGLGIEFTGLTPENKHALEGILLQLRA